MSRPVPDLAALGSAFRSLREAKGWTQEKLYLRTGLATPLISATENGRRNLSFQTIERWLSALEVSWTELGAAIDRAAPRR